MRLLCISQLLLAAVAAAQTQPDLIRNYGQGGRVDWCPVSNKIAFDQIVMDKTGTTGGWFDVFTADINATGGLANLTDLSFGSPLIPASPRRHVGNPAFSMDCNLMAIQVENNAEPCPTNANPANCEFKSGPGNGLYNDVYVCGLNTARTAFTSCQKVTSVSIAPANKINAEVGGTLHAIFSHDSPSSRLCWTELTSIGTTQGPDQVGIWKIGCAPLTYTNGVLSGIGRPGYMQPTIAGGQQKFYEFGSSGGTFGRKFGFQDDGWLYFVGNLKPQQQGNDYDVYRFNLNTRILQPLTNDTGIWNELPHISPDAKSLIWSSVRGNPAWTNAPSQAQILDLWQMTLPTDTTSLGSNLHPLTTYNVPGSPAFSPVRLTMAEQAWAPNGTDFIVCASHPSLEGIIFMTTTPNSPSMRKRKAPKAKSPKLVAEK